MLTKSNAVGYAVLALVVSRLTDEEFHSLSIEPYLNGRESGFAIHFYCYGRRFNRKFVFSEARRSDDIVVYEGKTYEFSMQGNGLTNEIYKNGKSFQYDKPYEAADYIFNRLRELQPLNTDDAGF